MIIFIALSIFLVFEDNLPCLGGMALESGIEITCLLAVVLTVCLLVSNLPCFLCVNGFVPGY